MYANVKVSIFAQRRAKKFYEVILLKKRITSFLMVLILLFSLCGCDAVSEIDTTSQTNVQAENINAETQDTKKIREDLEVEIAPGINSIQELMRVHFIDVGQADSAFIELGNGQTMLIDAGRDSSGTAIISIHKMNCNTILLIMLSHLIRTMTTSAVWLLFLIVSTLVKCICRNRLIQ